MGKTLTAIEFKAKLLRPADVGADWCFLRLPQEASAKLPSRSMQTVEGTFNGVPFHVTLEPDGEGGHWMKVKPGLRDKAGAKVGEVVELAIAPVKVEPEPEVPDDIRQALDANPTALGTWNDITAVARRDWIAWITSGKKAETRPKRIATALDKLSKGMRRACCFDRSGMYDKSLSCPLAAED